MSKVFHTLHRCSTLSLPSAAIAAAVALLASTCITFSASAQSADSARTDKMSAELRKRFAKADTNADSRLSREEAKAGMPRIYSNFDAIDVEKTGSVSLEQIMAFAVKQRSRN